MNPILKKVIFIMSYLVISIGLIVGAFLWIPEIDDFYGDFFTSSLPPNYELIQSMINYTALFLMMAAAIVFISFFVFSYALIKDKKDLAKKAWIIAWVSIFVAYVVISLVTPIGKFLS